MANSARIDELRKKFDENPRRYFAPLANEYRKAGDLEQALFICQEYLPQQPGHMSGHIVHGQALYDLGRKDEAKTAFETALSLDPENLIALRHLGDIARESGDTDTARMWYQRVLEADPRNEEIAQLMVSLRSASPVRAVSSAPTPLSTPSLPTIESWHSPVASEAAGTADDEVSAVFQVEKSEEATPPSTIAAGSEGARRRVNDDELLDFEDASIGSLSVSGAARKSSSGNAHEASSTAGGSGALLDEEGMFEADPFVIATPPAVPVQPASSIESFEPAASEPPIELATDINLGLPDDGRGTAETSASDVATLDGPETLEAGIVPPADGTGSLRTESYFTEQPASAGEALDTAAAQQADVQPQAQADPVGLESLAATAATEAAAHETAPIDGGHDGREVPAETSDVQTVERAGAFVTETMAELYLQQGHLEAALDIYRRLIDQRPDDAALAQRLRAVEERINGEAAGATPSGPTIRDFLLGVFRRAYLEPPLSLAEEQTFENPEQAESAGLGHPEAFDAVASYARPSSPTTVRGSIDALFSGANASSADASAAQALADAFPNERRATPLTGTPAHRVADELSLDHVFRGNAPPHPSGEAEGFSFDRFFAANAGDAASTPSTPSGAEPDTAEDIAQFNAWLNGLKKS